MDTKKLTKYKKQLLLEKERILNNQKRDLSDIKVDSDDLPDETDLAASEISQTLAFTLRDRQRLLLSEIDQALMRIENEQYGICEETGEPIEHERLMAVPWTRLSVEGAEIREKSRKRFA